MTHRWALASLESYVIWTRDISFLHAWGSDATVDRSVSGHKLPVQRIMRNRRMPNIRHMVEYTYAFMKRMFHFAHVMITTVQLVRVKAYSTAICYSVMRARFLDRIALAIDVTIRKA